MKVLIPYVLLVAASGVVAADVHRELPSTCLTAANGNACQKGCQKGYRPATVSGSCPNNSPTCCEPDPTYKLCSDGTQFTCLQAGKCPADRVKTVDDDGKQLFCNNVNNQETCCAPNSANNCPAPYFCSVGCSADQRVSTFDGKPTFCADGGSCCMETCPKVTFPDGSVQSGCFNSCGIDAGRGCGDVFQVNKCNASGGGGRQCATNKDVCCKPCRLENGPCKTSSDCCNSAVCKLGKCGPPGSFDDPWVNGIAGQHFNFDPKVTEDAWFAAVSDEKLQINLKLHKYDQGPYAQAAREYWIGASIQTFDEDGFAAQTLLLEARDGDNFNFSCKDLGANAPAHCLGGGAVDIFVNGVRMLEGGQVETGAGFMLAASNIVPACQAFTSEQKLVHAQAQESRHLAAFDFETFLTTRGVRKAGDCDRWIQTAKRNFGDIYKAPGSRFTLRYSSPHTVSIVEFDTHIPSDLTIEPMTFKINFTLLRLESTEGTEGLLGETARVRLGSDGQPIMTGKVLKGADADYKVDGPFGRDFAAKHL